MAELSQEALAAALCSIFEAEGLLISIDEGILVEEATAAPAAVPSAAPAAALAAAPENVPSHQDQPPDDSGYEDEQKQVIGLGHASDSGEDLPELDRFESEFEGFDDPGGFQGVGGVMGRGLGEGSVSEVSSVRTSDLSSNYDPTDSDEESDADVNVGSRFGILSDTVAAAEYQTRADLPAFQKQHRPLLHVAGDSAYVIFCSLWTDDTLDLFVEETNRYYRERIDNLGGAGQLKPDSRDRNWEDLTRAELKTFLANLIMMGVCQFNSYHLYWSTMPAFDVPGFRNLMSSN